MTSYKACSNPACMRKVAPGSGWCCGGCEQAQRGRYDPDGYHSALCDQRAQERGEFAYNEWLVARAYLR